MEISVNQLLCTIIFFQKIFNLGDLGDLSGQTHFNNFKNKYLTKYSI